MIRLKVLVIMLAVVLKLGLVLDGEPLGDDVDQHHSLVLVFVLSQVLAAFFNVLLVIIGFFSR